MAASITIDGVRYYICKDGAVTAPPDPNTATPYERQWWWKAHPFARSIRKRHRQRGRDRLLARMCREFAEDARRLHAG